MSRGLILQVVVSGLAAGAVYGLVAIGFSLVYRLTSVLQFAHGDLLGASLYVALAAGSWPLARSSVSLASYGAGAVAALAVAGALGAGMYAGVVRPFLRRNDVVGLVGVTVAVAFAIQGALPALVRRESSIVAEPFPFDRWGGFGVGDGVRVPYRALWVLFAGVLLGWAAQWVIRRTRFGVAVQAASSDPQAAEIVGLPLDRLAMLAFAIAGVLAAAAGLLGVPATGSLAPATGLALGLKGIAAAMLGGLGEPRRVLVAGLALGVVEGAVVSLHVPGLPALGLGPAWADVAPILIAIAALALRPPAGARERVE